MTPRSAALLRERAELRAELVEDMGRTLGRLSGPHALVEVARLAGVGSRAN